MYDILLTFLSFQDKCYWHSNPSLKKDYVKKLQVKCHMNDKMVFNVWPDAQNLYYYYYYYYYNYILSN